MLKKHQTLLGEWSPWLREFVDARATLNNLTLENLQYGSKQHQLIYEGGKTFQERYDILHSALLEVDDDKVPPPVFDIFLNSLKQSHQTWIAEFLEFACENLRTENNWNQLIEKLTQKDIIQNSAKLIAPAAEKADAKIIYQSLYDRGVITEEDRQRVDAEFKNKGNNQAMNFLLSILIRKDPNWIKALSEIAKENRFLELGEFCDCFIDVVSDKMMNGNEKSILLEHAGQGAQELDAVPPNEIFINKPEEEILNAEQRQNFNTLRSYQHELAKPALEGKNVIICAPTGSGKTHVASHAIEKHLEKYPAGKVLFFVPKVALAKQQSDSIQRFLGKKHKVNYLVGGMNQTPEISILSCDVLVLTPKLLEASMSKKDPGINSLTEFSLLVFDECHHTRKGEPYMEIMNKYHQQSLDGNHSENLPQVIGLTATPGSGGKSGTESVQKHLKILCANLDAKGGIVRVQNNLDEMNSLTPYAMEDQRQAHEAEEMNDPCTKILCSFMDTVIEMMVEYASNQEFRCNVNRPSLCKGSDPFKQWCNELIELLRLSQDNKYTRNIIAFQKYLDIYNKALEIYFMCRTVDAITVLEDYRKNVPGDSNEKILTGIEETLDLMCQRSIDKLKKHIKDPSCENKNLKQIEDVIFKCFSDDTDSRCILSVKMRRYASLLQRWLSNDCNKLKRFNLNPRLFTGTGNKRNDTETSGLTHNKQEAILEMFKKGDTKLIVSTPEAVNEGVDVGNCNIVICYNYIKGEIGYQQMKGRVRQDGGMVINLSSKKVWAEDISNQRKALEVEQNIEKLEKNRKEDEQGFLQELRQLQHDSLAEFNAKNSEDHTSSLSEYQLSCGGCSIPVCETTDIRLVGDNTYMCQTLNFYRNILEESVAGNNNAYVKCKKCNHKWGRKTNYKGVDIIHLLCEQFKFNDVLTPMESFFKRKWARVNFTPQKMEFPDLCKFVKERHQNGV